MCSPSFDTADESHGFLNWGRYLPNQGITSIPPELGNITGLQEL